MGEGLLGFWGFGCSRCGKLWVYGSDVRTAGITGQDEEIWLGETGVISFGEPLPRLTMAHPAPILFIGNNDEDRAVP